VFEFLSDLAGHVAFSDHYLEQFRLTSPRSSGLGAGARFKAKGQWGEWAIADVLRPRRIALEGGLGRLGQTRLYALYELSPHVHGVTRVDLTIQTAPHGKLGNLREMGAERWWRRQSKVALERLRKVFEEPGRAPLARATVAGFEPLKAPRFGASIPHGGGAGAGSATSQPADRGH
jgi:hypothetical protein